MALTQVAMLSDSKARTDVSVKAAAPCSCGGLSFYTWQAKPGHIQMISDDSNQLPSPSVSANLRLAIALKSFLAAVCMNLKDSLES